MRFIPVANSASRADGDVCSFAYVEFSGPESVDAALAMDNSLFRGRLIKVSAVPV